jgi:hypothetical protein
VRRSNVLSLPLPLLFPGTMLVTLSTGEHPTQVHRRQQEGCRGRRAEEVCRGLQGQELDPLHEDGRGAGGLERRARQGLGRQELRPGVLLINLFSLSLKSARVFVTNAAAKVS